MQFREVTYTQQLQYQRLIHGPESDISERSLPNLPGTAMREILKHSQHPQNLEQVLLTLRRPVNSVTRKRFAEVGGELVLIQKTTSTEPVLNDFKIAHFGQIIDLPEGMLYPTQDHTTLFETWIRVEMLDALRMMIEENLVRSLLPDMQLKLITDMLDLSADPKQAELVRLYSFGVAVAAVKRFHAARAAAMSAGFPAKTAAFLEAVLEGPHAADSIYSRDPFEQIKGITAAIEGLYLVALTNAQGEYNLGTSSTSSNGKSNGSTAAAAAADDPAAAIAAAVAAGATLGSLDRSLEGLTKLQEAGAGLLLSKAVEKLWQLLQDREGFQYTPPACLSAKASAETADANGSKADKAEGEQTEPEAEETEEQKKLRAAAEEAVALANVTFEENWQMFLKAVYDTELVPICVGVWLQLAAALLQLLVYKQGEKQQMELPSKEVLQQMSACTKQPSLAVAGRILSSMAAGNGGNSSSSADDAAIMLLPGYEDAELLALAKSCCCCNKMEGKEVKLLRCGQCGCANYCSSNCQKMDWKLGHKGMCKDLGNWRTTHCNGHSNGTAVSS